MKRLLTTTLASLTLLLTSCTNPFGDSSLVDFSSIASLDWSNKDYDFGNQQIGSTSVKTFFISNSGTSDATNCGSVTLSDQVNFGIISQTCTTPTLAAGSQCEVVVESHPQTAGEKNLVIDRQCRVNATLISLTNQVKVTAVLPTAQWTPMSHSFGMIQTNQGTFGKKFVLSNQGSSAITNCGLVSLSNATDFSIIGDTCGLNNLAQNSSCEITVMGHPSADGIKTTTLNRTCESNVIFSTGLDQITTEGFDSPYGLYSSSIDLGNAAQGAAAYASVYMQNETLSVPVSCTQAVLNDMVNFSIFNDDCGTRGLNSWEYCAIGVEALTMSASLGEHETTLVKSCTFADSSVKLMTIPVRVNIVPAVPSLVVYNSTQDFGTTYVGGIGTDQVFYFVNNGTGPATSCGLPSVDQPNDFSVVIDNCNGANIAPNGYCDVTVRALPYSVGIKTSNLSLTCAVGGTVSAALQQTVKPNAPDLSFSPSNYNYNSVGVGGNADRVFSILNQGPSAANGCNSPVLSNTTDFMIVGDTCTMNDVSANGSCSITIRAVPSSIGLKSGTLTRDCSNGGSVTANLEVTGFMAAPNLNWSQASHDYGDVNIGANSITVNMYLYNNGTAAATGCSAPVLSNSTDFTISYQSCGVGDMAVGANCYAQVFANPQSAGLLNTTLSRTCSVGGTASVQYTVNGKLTADWQTEYSGIANLGAISIGKTSKTVKYFFRNPNDDVLTGCTLASIDNTNDFNIVTNNCAAGSMAAGTACMVEVRGVGVSLGAKTAQLSRSCTETGNKNISFQSTTGPAGKAISLATGYLATCAVMDTGTVRCWGSGRFHASDYPMEKAGITNAIKVSVADYQGCALLATGEVNCWGWTAYGVLGTPSGGVIPGLNNVVDIVAGKESTCAVVNDGVTEIGVVKCWGGGNPYSPQPVTVIPYTSTGLPITGVIQVAAGGYDGREFCALLGNQTVVCGDFYGTGSYTMAPRAGITDAVEISMTNGSMYYRTNSNQVKVNQYGSSTLVPGSSNAIKLAANNTPYSGNSCAIFDNGTTEIGVVKCWDAVNTTAALVNGLDHIVSVSSGSESLICALNNTGEVKCRGQSRYYGQLGDLTNQDRRTINKFDMGGPVEQASTSITSCALLQSGQIKCWGWAAYDGQAGLGDGVTGQSATPVLVSGITDATEVKTGYGFACAILGNENVKCWGWNWFGKLGTGNSTSSKVPVSVINLSNVKTMAMSDQIACAVMNDGVVNIGTVRCWGSNEPTPVDKGISGATKIAATGYTMCAVLNTGAIKCWGDNSIGQFGNGSTVGSVTPTDVLGINNAVDITAGIGHFCALLNDGTAKCWGGHNESQIGNSPNNTIPYLIPGLTGIQHLMATSYRTCALLNSNVIKCFGTDVGDLTSNRYTKPQTVMNVSDAKKLVPGFQGQLCYINLSDELMCKGQLETGGFSTSSGF